MKDAYKIAHETILFLTKIPTMAKNGIINVAQAVCHSSFPSPQMRDCGSTHKRYENNKSTGMAKSQKKAEANLRETLILALPIATGRLKITDHCGALLRSSVWWCSGFGCLCLLRQAGNRKMRKMRRIAENANTYTYHIYQRLKLQYHDNFPSTNIQFSYPIWFFYPDIPLSRIPRLYSCRVLNMFQPFLFLKRTRTAETQTAMQTNFS